MYMSTATTKMIFGIRPALKKAAMKKAREHGLSYASVLNVATQAYVDGSLNISAFDERMAQSIADAQVGRTYTLAEVKKKLSLK